MLFTSYAYMMTNVTTVVGTTVSQLKFEADNNADCLIRWNINPIEDLIKLFVTYTATHFSISHTSIISSRHKNCVLSSRISLQNQSFKHPYRFQKEKLLCLMSVHDNYWYLLFDSDLIISKEILEFNFQGNFFQLI